METPQLLAKHVRDVHFGGNWTSVNLKETLTGLDWSVATKKIDSFNTIVALVYHINYYVATLVNVLKGHELDAHDKFSFTHPPVESQADWDRLLEKSWTDAETFASLVEQLPVAALDQYLAAEKYGTWHRNLLGVIEHTHYHLGQLILLKKLLTLEKIN